MEKLSVPGRAATGSIKDELARLKTAAVAIQKIRLSAQRELELAKQIRAEAQRYQQETEAKARSQAQQLILRTRQATQKEIEELMRQEIEEIIHQASAEIQKMLADMRTIRIAAQEELTIQKKYTDAARICSLSPTLQEKTGESESEEEKQLAYKK